MDATNINNQNSVIASSEIGIRGSGSGSNKNNKI
jgi:hypothetical protein